MEQFLRLLAICLFQEPHPICKVELTGSEKRPLSMIRKGQHLSKDIKFRSNLKKANARDFISGLLQIKRAL